MTASRTACLLFPLIVTLVGCRAAPSRPDNGLLWVRTSAEYAALCQQVYAQAAEALAHDSAASNDSPCGQLPRAVVMDLDQTVLDNSLFDVWTEVHGVDPADMGQHWDYWIRHYDHTAELLPGSLEFVTVARDNDISIIFISNRDESTRGQTVATLERLGVSEPSKGWQSSLLLQTTTSGKDERRATIEETFCVIALVGDNLADFSSSYEWRQRGTLADRREHALQIDGDKWGRRWFVLPNPVYGDWRRKLTESEIAALRADVPPPMTTSH